MVATWWSHKDWTSRRRQFDFRSSSNFRLGPIVGFVTTVRHDSTRQPREGAENRSNELIFCVCPIWPSILSFLNNRMCAEIDPGKAITPFASSILDETRFGLTTSWSWVEFNRSDAHSLHCISFLLLKTPLKKTLLLFYPIFCAALVRNQFWRITPSWIKTSCTCTCLYFCFRFSLITIFNQILIASYL